LKDHQEPLEHLEMTDLQEYLACLEKWESKGNLEIREL